MRFFTDTYVFAFVSAGLCIVIMSTCMCRQVVASKGVLIRVRAAYTALGAAAFAVLLGPLYGEWPRWSTLTFEVAVIGYLFSGSHNWKGKMPPRDVMIDPSQPTIKQRCRRVMDSALGSLW